MKTIVLKIFVAVLLLSLAANSALGAASQQAPDENGVNDIIYYRQRADTPRLFSWMSQRSLAVDSGNKSHLAYGADHLYYAVKETSGWQTQMVDDSYSVGLFASLALDSSKRPHISYYDAANGALKYAYFDGVEWAITVVDELPAGAAQEGLPLEEDLDARTVQPGLDTLRESYGPISATLGITGTMITAEEPPVVAIGVGLYTSIAIDKFNHPGISYYDAKNGALKYAYWDGLAWNVQTVDNDDDTGRYTSLVFDSTGKPQISYYDATNGNLRYVRWGGTGWTYTNVDDVGDVGRFTSIGIDRNGYTHISYYDVGNSSLKHAKFVSSWAKETVVGSDATDAGMYSSIVLPKTTDRIMISYFDATNSDLEYAYWTGSKWEIYPVGTGDLIGRYTSAAIDKDDRLHISYYDSGLGQLREAYISTTGPISSLVDTAYDVGYYTDLALDGSFNAHIAYHDDIQDDLRYAKWDGNIWTTQVIDPTSQGGLFNSIALDSSGNPHISYYDYGADAVKYAKWNGANWEIRTVATGIGSRPDVDLGMSTGIALDPSNNYPRIAFYQGGTASGKYCASDDPCVALWTGSSWTFKSFDSNDDAGRYIDIKIDSSRIIHLAYMIGSHSSTDQYLRYARLDSSGNKLEVVTIDNTGSAGFFANLALDGNVPHVAYFDDDGDDLKHAWNESGWRQENVDTTTQSTGWHPSIFVSPSGVIYISYYDATLRDLKLAAKTGTTWSLRAVDSQGDVGKYSAIAVHSNGLPAIAYIDVSNGDLIYLRQFDFTAANYLYLPTFRK